MKKKSLKGLRELAERAAEDVVPDLPDWSRKASDYAEQWSVKEYRKQTAEKLKPITKDYWISNMGEILSYKSGGKKILKGRPTHKGYLRVALKIDGEVKDYTIHRLVAINFISNPDDLPEINHKDGIKSNNHVDNLEWVTSSENLQDAYDTGLREKPKGMKHPKRKLSASQVKYIRQSNAKGTELAKMFEVTKSAIYHIRKNRTWTEFNTEK